MTIFIIQACGLIKEEIVPEAQVDILFISDLGNVIFVFFAATLFLATTVTAPGIPIWAVLFPAPGE